MPTPNKSGAAPAPTRNLAELTAMASNGPLLARRNLKVASPKDAWTWMVSPAKLGSSDGLIVPLLAKAYHTPGFNGNLPGHLVGQGAQANLAAEGFVAIPHNFPVKAFGQMRENCEISTYLDRHMVVDPSGRTVEHYVSAFHRPRQLGHLTDWEFDRKGYDEFRRSALALTGFKELTEQQVAIAIQPLEAIALELLDRDDARSKRMLREVLGHIPKDRLSPDLAERLDAARKPRGGTRKKPAPKKPSAGTAPDAKAEGADS